MGTGRGWPWPPRLGALFWGKSGFEEGRLLAHFPAYAAYRDRVRRRLIPWVL